MIFHLSDSISCVEIVQPEYVMDDLFQILPGLVKAFPDSGPVKQAVGFAMFRKAAGPGLLEHTIPVELDSGKLTVLVADKTWKRNLESLAPGMITTLNKLAGMRLIKFIEFVIDENAFESSIKPGKSAQEAADEYPIPNELKRKAEAIKDPALRQQFLDSAAAYLSARDKKKLNR